MKSRMWRVGYEMEMEDYQKDAMTTAVYPDAGQGGDRAVLYAALKLASEAGEVAGKVGKALRGDYSLSEGKDLIEIAKLREDVFSELGDVLWYVAALCNEFGWSMGEIAQQNLLKLLRRKEAGTLKGNGDQR